MKVTDEMVERACRVYFHGSMWYKKSERLKENERPAMRAALEAVLGDLPEVRVPDYWPYKNSPDQREDAYRRGWNDCRRKVIELNATPAPPRGE